MEIVPVSLRFPDPNELTSRDYLIAKASRESHKHGLKNSFRCLPIRTD